MKKIKLNNRQLGYLEGIIDGEGCICLSHEALKSGSKTYKPELSIANTNKNVIYMLKNWIGGSITITKKKNPFHRTCYNLRFKSQALRELLPLLSLTIKEKQRVIMLKALIILGHRRYGFGSHNPNYSTNKLEKIYQKLRILNGNQGAKSSKKQ